MPKAGDGTQEPAQRTCPVILHFWSCVCDARLNLCGQRRPQGLPLSNVEFLGEMSDVLHSDALLPLIPPAPFSHKGRRGSLGVLMPETGDGTQRFAKNLSCSGIALPAIHPRRGTTAVPSLECYLEIGLDALSRCRLPGPGYASGCAAGGAGRCPTLGSKPTRCGGIVPRRIKSVRIRCTLDIIKI